ncbi:hypothetical protein IEO21_03466 [Rhodonia placenta]|uniref:PAH2 domain-containing protein n=1 Tax=Rhodonia placenta TaxID=104341 RepID=A0A8H7P5M9_9APHY|nr:hypothetical protein IEO21_03466 [Postia placenta]
MRAELGHARIAGAGPGSITRDASSTVRCSIVDGPLFPEAFSPPATDRAAWREHTTRRTVFTRAIAHSEYADGAQSPGPPGSSTRLLNVRDALGYLDAIKAQFQDRPEVYNRFLDIMKDFKYQVKDVSARTSFILRYDVIVSRRVCLSGIDTPGVIARVSMLFHSSPYLIQSFNTFLPPGYRIDVSTDPQNPGMVTVTTPTSVDVQYITPFPPDHPFSPSIMFAPPAAGPQAVSAASFPGNLGNGTNEGMATIGELNHAIQFLNKVKMRFEEDPDTYEQFLETLHAYQRQPQDSQVYARVQALFKDAPDLVNEFCDFWPEALGPSSQHLGLLNQTVVQNSSIKRQQTPYIPPLEKRNNQLQGRQSGRPRERRCCPRPEPVDRPPVPRGVLAHVRDVRRAVKPLHVHVEAP